MRRVRERGRAFTRNVRHAGPSSRGRIARCVVAGGEIAGASSALVLHACAGRGGEEETFARESVFMAGLSAGVQMFQAECRFVARVVEWSFGGPMRSLHNLDPAPTTVVFRGLHECSPADRTVESPCNHGAPCYHEQGHKAEGGTNTDEDCAFGEV